MKVWDLHCDTLSELRKPKRRASLRALPITICILTLKNYSKAITCCNALRRL